MRPRAPWLAAFAAAAGLLAPPSVLDAEPPPRAEVPVLADALGQLADAHRFLARLAPDVYRRISRATNPAGRLSPSERKRIDVVVQGSGLTLEVFDRLQTEMLADRRARARFERLVLEARR